MAKKLYPNDSQWNTIGDAYRHTFWNALCVVRLGETLTEQLTTAHEDQPQWYSYDFKETQMDLFNNAKGREIAYRAGLLWELVKIALENGELKQLKPLGFEIEGQFYPYAANESSTLTPTNQ